MKAKRPELKARAALAAELAMVDRDRLNEAIAAGHYPCAPATAKGATRIFAVNDIVVLWLYGQLLSNGSVPRSAGAAACKALAILETNPECGAVLRVTAINGASFWIDAAHFKRDAKATSGQLVVRVDEWRVGVIREWIKDQLEQAANVVGDDD